MLADSENFFNVFLIVLIVKFTMKIILSLEMKNGCGYSVEK